MFFIFYFVVIVIKFYKRIGVYYVFDLYSRGLDGLCCLDGIVVVIVFYLLENICLFLRNLCVFLNRIIFLEKV